jgi:transposase InsO family protein
VWTADFKGQFRLGNGELCYPLTIVDAYSRYLLMCRALRGTQAELARRGFEAALYFQPPQSPQTRRLARSRCQYACIDEPAARH